MERFLSRRVLKRSSHTAMERRTLQNHSELVGMDQLRAQQTYIKLCKKLDVYGGRFMRVQVRCLPAHLPASRP